MKEVYEKPEIALFELTPEERLANSSNCAAERGSVNSQGNPCDPAENWSADSDVTP